eukprot:COSAG06_NODE_399_length_16207_cov_61.131984_4_plen_228_part_00
MGLAARVHRRPDLRRQHRGGPSHWPPDCCHDLLPLLALGLLGHGLPLHIVSSAAELTMCRGKPWPTHLALAPSRHRAQRVPLSTRNGLRVRLRCSPLAMPRHVPRTSSGTPGTPWNTLEHPRRSGCSGALRPAICGAIDAAADSGSAGRTVPNRAGLAGLRAMKSRAAEPHIAWNTWNTPGTPLAPRVFQHRLNPDCAKSSIARAFGPIGGGRLGAGTAGTPTSSNS